ncbi:ATP-binding protein [Leptolyngbya sp. FACHB-261]|uniref:ATP-binding protein n=1 Tax=Leptolyngbya sp. FACHB-261 TaxID=2692806 RepID=UPI001682978B|nr:ATP-binding protein [Leptolyngbya sp. FACHB-261]MBD2099370.1 ATP-binding protein [Leptolyngbya sp. FACHB-261]
MHRDATVIAKGNSAEIEQKISTLLLFQEVLADSVGQAFCHLITLLTDHAQSGMVTRTQLLQAYGQLFSSQAATGRSWLDHLIGQILTADNPFTRGATRTDFCQLPAALVAAASHDLHLLQQLKHWDTAHFWSVLEEQVGVGQGVTWEVPPPPNLVDIAGQLRQVDDWGTCLAGLSSYYRQTGVGLANCVAFRWQNSELAGVEHPDPVKLSDLAGYASQQELLVRNTEFLLRGYPALNVLLYGGRGTGKSSLVKAMLNEYSDRGLRLVEVAKSDLIELTQISERLRELPQKFILFVDDLSFETDERSYSPLKVLLEGSLSARPQNLVVYATSNRRHLVREFFADRPKPGVASARSSFATDQEDEVHAWDTVQEKLSFSDRFGLTLTFMPPDQTQYLEIVRHLSKQASIELTDSDLEARALQWATRHNGRSGRSARQFVDFLAAEIRLAREI